MKTFRRKFIIKKHDAVNLLKDELQNAKLSIHSFQKELDENVEAFCFGIDHCIKILENKFELTRSGVKK